MGARGSWSDLSSLFTQRLLGWRSPSLVFVGSAQSQGPKLILWRERHLIPRLIGLVTKGCDSIQKNIGYNWRVPRFVLGPSNDRILDKRRSLGLFAKHIPSELFDSHLRHVNNHSTHTHTHTQTCSFGRSFRDIRPAGGLRRMCKDDHEAWHQVLLFRRQPGSP